MSEKFNFYVTFGPNHVPYHNNYTIITAESEYAARKLLRENIGLNTWNFVYVSPEAAGVDRLNLQYVSMEEVFHCQPSSYSNYGCV